AGRVDRRRRRYNRIECGRLGRHGLSSPPRRRVVAAVRTVRATAAPRRTAARGKRTLEARERNEQCTSYKHEQPIACHGLMHRALIDAMRSQPAFAGLRHCLPAPGNTCTLAGLAGSAPSLLIAALADAMPQRIWVVVAHSPGEAEAIEADLQSLYDAERVTLYPQRETLPYEATEHHVEVSGLRVEAIEALLSGRVRVLVTTGRALQERAELPSGLAELRTTLRVGDEVRLQELAERLDELGFERTPLVDGV